MRKTLVSNYRLRLASWKMSVEKQSIGRSFLLKNRSIGAGKAAERMPVAGEYESNKERVRRKLKSNEKQRKAPWCLLSTYVLAKEWIDRSIDRSTEQSEAPQSWSSTHVVCWWRTGPHHLPDNFPSWHTYHGLLLKVVWQVMGARPSFIDQNSSQRFRRVFQKFTIGSNSGCGLSLSAFVYCSPADWNR